RARRRDSKPPRPFPSLLGAEELVHQDGAVVADHPARDAAVVVLVADAAAAASVVELVGDQALFVPILVVLSAHDLSARRRLALEAGNGGSHRFPPCSAGAGHGPRPLGRVLEYRSRL